MEVTIGMSFHDWVVLAKAPSGSNGRAVYLCRCSCGTVREVLRQSLIAGKSKNCGCKRIKRRGVNIIGCRFGRLFVIEQSNRKSPSGALKWKCMCDCGSIVYETAYSLQSGHTVSCGCYMRQNNAEKLRIRRLVHGRSGTKEYNRAVENKRRERKAHLDVLWTPEMESALTKLQPFCVLCGDTKRMSTDHVHPLSLGYGLVPGNAVRLCSRCNSKKNALDLNLLAPETRALLLDAAQQFKSFWDTYK